MLAWQNQRNEAQDFTKSVVFGKLYAGIRYAVSAGDQINRMEFQFFLPPQLQLFVWP